METVKRPLCGSLKMLNNSILSRTLLFLPRCQEARLDLATQTALHPTAPQFPLVSKSDIIKTCLLPTTISQRSAFGLENCLKLFEACLHHHLIDEEGDLILFFLKEKSGMCMYMCVFSPKKTFQMLIRQKYLLYVL